ncbi:HD-GYP domain-containing protein [Egibacter rhizosphaerae]|uniref:HD-GYP domain-containing protein n=1 Tax=Egibacter rhizosphaerae TaxID=1670831 RepID=UPI0013F15B12|nr:HD-GYP domain-containing protein [Egibacter rhizosphaerae]
MHTRSLQRVAAGDVLAEDVRDADEQVLLRVGTTLTDAYIASLRARGVPAVRIADGAPDWVGVDDPLHAEVRRETSLTLRTLFSNVSGAARQRFDDGTVPANSAALATRLGEAPLSDGTAEGQLEATVSRLIDSVLEREVLDGLAQLKNHSDYTFTHSVEVAALAVGIGHRLGLSTSNLRDLATGCLLHDVGKSLVDSAVIDKPGPLDEAERTLVKEHPELGYEVIRRLHLASVLPGQIALQHHERQDGAGYPRGLHGSNRIRRTTQERVDPRTMMLLAEICAVADIHNAISSDRPYRPAMPAEEVMAVIERNAGGHLNRELVELLRRTVPVYPRGTWVQILTGAYVGWRGQVTKTPLDHPYRPRILLALDDRLQALEEPRPLDCSDQHVDVRALAPEQPATEPGCLAERTAERVAS